jgi:hypothetical protein
LLALLNYVEGAGLQREVIFGLFVMIIGQKILLDYGGLEPAARVCLAMMRAIKGSIQSFKSGSSPTYSPISFDRILAFSRPI